MVLFSNILFHFFISLCVYTACMRRCILLHEYICKSNMHVCIFKISSSLKVAKIIPYSHSYSFNFRTWRGALYAARLHHPSKTAKDSPRPAILKAKLGVLRYKDLSGSEGGLLSSQDRWLVHHALNFALVSADSVLSCSALTRCFGSSFWFCSFHFIPSIYLCVWLFLTHVFMFDFFSCLILFCLFRSI